MKRIYSKQCAHLIGQEVTLLGWIHKIRSLGGVNFLILRDGEGLIQIVLDQKHKDKIKGLGNESVVQITGMVKKEPRAPGGVEIQVSDLVVLSKVSGELPLEINREGIEAKLDTILRNRTIALRNLKLKLIFKIQSKILEAFRNFFGSRDFTEIKTPKIVSAGAESGGAEMFEIDYFDRKAYLAQSPQLYKQIMVGVFEKVFEIGPVFRAEPHDTTRHLNEYISLDMEMGFINGLDDLLKIHQEFIEYLIDHLSKTCQEELRALKITLPKLVKIPILTFQEAQKLLEKNYHKKCLGLPDLKPDHEQLIGHYSQKKWKSDFVFITHYPRAKKPFYVADDPKNPQLSLSFDILFRGLEITTGGQRIHLYDNYLKKMKEFGLNPTDFAEFLEVFKYGMPPHGGSGTGLERLTMKLLNLENIREASLFPRDINRIKP